MPAYAVTSTAGQPLNADYVFPYTFLPGDATKNGVVDTLDFTILATHFGQTGQTWSTGDFNYDGAVNALDFNALATNFGSNLASASVTLSVQSPLSISPPAPSNSIGSLFSTHPMTPGDDLEKLLELWNLTDRVERRYCDQCIAPQRGRYF